MSLVRSSPFSPARRGGQLSKSTQHHVQASHEHGVAVAADLNAQAYATRVALTNIAALSSEEALFASELPHAEGRFRAVVDAYTIGAVSQIQRMNQ